MRILARLKEMLPFGRKTEIHSFVLLLECPRAVDAATVRRIVERELGVTVPAEPDEEDPAASWVIGEPPTVVARVPDGTILVNSVPHPYSSNPERMARQVREMRRRKVVAEHAAWVSADWMGDRDEAGLARGYPIIGKVAAALAEPGCLGIYVPACQYLIPWESEVAEALRSDDPRAALGQATGAPVIPVSDDDPRLRAGVEEARRRWPEFVEAFGHRRPGQAFSVKAPITDGKNTEFIWLEVAEIDGDTITGDLANEPVNLRFMRLGSRVRTRVSELNDWAYLEGGEMRGGFTVAAVEAAAQRKR